MWTVRHLPHPFPLALLLAAGLLGGPGCDSGPDSVVSVTGRVTHNDKPVAGLTVSFVPQTTTSKGVSTGTTDEDGHYKLTLAKTGQSGAVVGPHKVWVSLPRQPEEYDKGQKKAFRNSPAPVPPEIEAILEKYGNLEKTPLTVEVKDGQSLDLKLD